MINILMLNLPSRYILIYGVLQESWLRLWEIRQILMFGQFEQYVYDDLKTYLDES